MAQNILKNTGKLLLPLIFACFCTVLNAAEVETELSPSKIPAGESALLKIKISGSTSKINPLKFPAIDGLRISFSGSSRSFQFINGKTWSGTILNFSIFGEKKGVYRIPPFILEADGEKISSREVILTVSEYLSHGKSSGTTGSLRPDIMISSETVYTGEPLIMHYIIYTGGNEPPRVRGFIEQPGSKGFVMKGLEGMQDEGDKTYAGSFCLIPVDKGDHFIGGGSVEATVESDRGFFSMDERRKINFPYKKVRVIPIPAEGKPDSFNGDVGEFKLNAEVPGKNFKVLEEIKIPVKISGRGNLITLSKPAIENGEGIRFIVEEKEQVLSLNGNTLSGEKQFIATIIPQKEGNLNPGKIFISYFNPFKKTYEKAESQPFSFEITGGVNTGEKGEVQFSTDSRFMNKFKSAYIAAVLIVIILSVAGLVMWEKKKLKMLKTELGMQPAVNDEAGNDDRESDILKKIQVSIGSGNRDLFLLHADRAINRIDETGLSDNEKVKYNSLKEKIYYSRYAGGDFTESDMKDLYSWIKKHIR